MKADAFTGFYRYVGFVLLLAIWSGLTYSHAVPDKYLPSPTGLLAHFIDLAQNGFNGVPLWQHVLASVTRTLTGFLLGVLFGIPIGLAMGYYKPVGELLGPIFAFVRPIPPIAFIPLAVLYFGIGEASKIILIFFAVFLFVVLNTHAGVKSVSRTLIRAGRNLGFTHIQLFRYVIFPGAMPSVMAGVRTGLAISWALVVAAELIAAQSGIGYMIETAGNFFHLDTVFVGIVLIGAIGLAMDQTILLVQGRVLHWQGR